MKNESLFVLYAKVYYILNQLEQKCIIQSVKIVNLNIVVPELLWNINKNISSLQSTNQMLTKQGWQHP